MKKFQNNSNVPLSVAVYLATDTYDKHENTISVTALLRPLRQLVLADRVPVEDTVVDVQNLYKSRLGTSIHDGIERAWINNHKQAMIDLGYPEKVADLVKINPTAEELKQNPDMEQRASKEIEGFTITGKFDFIAEGVVEDFKTTITYTYSNDTKSDDHVMQGSMYRWLNPDKITAEFLRITYLFMDWVPYKLKTDKNYPPTKILPVEYKLKSLEETEAFIRGKLLAYKSLKDAPEDQLPECTDKELWRKDPAWKYYKNPEKMSRSTKNFTSKQEAYTRLAVDGGVGVIVHKPGEVVACKYCPAFLACKQKDRLIADGSLIL
jgi:hypothetical protein